MSYPLRFDCFEGVAIGGPRAGVKLTASPGWNGIVNQPRAGTGNPVPYPGRYRFDPKLDTWVWEAK